MCKLSFLRKKGAKFKTLGQNIERLNEEIRKRERVIRIFTNRESVICLLGALLMEQDEKWTTGKKYFDMEEYFTWRESEILSQTHKVTRIF